MDGKIGWATKSASSIIVVTIFSPLLTLVVSDIILTYWNRGYIKYSNPFPLSYSLYSQKTGLGRGGKGRKVLINFEVSLKIFTEIPHKKIFILDPITLKVVRSSSRVINSHEKYRRWS